MVEEDFTILDQVPSVVHINVGGQLFLTSRETLLKVPNSLFCKMFQGDVAVKKVKQTDNVYFVDRDPTHFQRVLNFLRDGSCVLPSGAEQRKELLVEARHYQLPDLEDQVSGSLADAALEDLRLDFRSIVLRHHAATGDLNRLIEVFLGFVRSHLVTITPMTDVNDESRLHVYWLSATLPPSKPSCVAFRYRGEKEANDVGVTVNESDDSFAQWARLWDLYHSKQLVTTFKALMQRCGLKVHFASRVETFKQDSQLDVVWKMYRVRSLSLAISHLACT